MAPNPIYTNKLILELLHKVPMFSMFSEEELRKMLYSGKLVKIDKFQAGEVLLEEGTYGKWVHVLMKGSVKVTKHGAEIATLKDQGEVLGEIGALNDTVRSATVTAITDAVCISFNLSVVEHMSETEKNEYLTKIRGFLMPIIEQRLQQTMEISEVLAEVRQKKSELSRLQRRLEILGASEEKSVMELLLSGEE